MLIARRRGGQQPVEEALLDVGRQRGASGDTAEQHALDDRAGDREVEEVVDLREVRQVHGAIRTTTCRARRRTAGRSATGPPARVDGRSRSPIASTSPWSATATGSRSHRRRRWQSTRSRHLPRFRFDPPGSAGGPAGVAHRVGRTFQPIAGRLGEHVVETRLVELEVLNLHTGLVEGPDDVGDCACTTPRPTPRVPSDVVRISPKRASVSRAVNASAAGRISAASARRRLPSTRSVCLP